MDGTSSKNISNALELIDKLPKQDRCSLYERIVRKQVLLGKLDDAKNTFQNILDPNSISEANNWILAGQIAEANNIANAISHATQFSDNPIYYLMDIARSKVKAGKIKEAERIIDSISEQDSKVDGYIAIARYYLRKDQNNLFKIYLHKAKRNNEHANRTLYQTLNFWYLAILQAETGNWDAALVDAKKAENLDNIFNKKMQEKYGEWTHSGGLYNDGKQLYRLMLHAGRFDDVLQITLNNNEFLSYDITQHLTYSN